MAENVKDLEAAAAGGERQVAEIDQRLKAAVAEEERITVAHAAAVGSGASGKPLAELSAARDLVQLRIVSLKQDLAAVRAGAKQARQLAAEAVFRMRTQELSARLAGAAAQIEAALRAVGYRWLLFAAAADDARELGRAIGVHEHCFKVTIPRPTAGDAALTSNLYHLASRVRSELATLDNLRHEAAHPSPSPGSLARAILISGDSPRARRQRQSLTVGPVSVSGRR